MCSYNYGLVKQKLLSLIIGIRVKKYNAICKSYGRGRKYILISMLHNERTLPSINCRHRCALQ